MTFGGSRLIHRTDFGVVQVVEDLEYLVGLGLAAEPYATGRSFGQSGQGYCGAEHRHAGHVQDALEDLALLDEREVSGVDLQVSE
jgi:hypothetical protein